MTNARRQRPTHSFASRPREAEAVGDILGKALRQRGLASKVARYSGFHLWPQIVGEKIAAIAQPMKIIRANVLQVKVVDPVWAQELALMKHDLLEKLGGGVLGSVIEDIQFVIEGPTRKGN